ncbi:hypothetical protein FRC12_022974 [Ceratobasidium sp. 428]|nr:hypothetical protein FRC12_022974 [Ceratobasidium sp. 428]
MPLTTLKLSRVLSRLLGWRISNRSSPPHSTIAEWIEQHRPHPAPSLMSSTTVQPHINQLKLNEDILLCISGYLTTSRDKLVLALLCRWHYLVLKCTPFTYLVLSQDVQLKSLATQLAADQGRRDSVLHLDATFPSLFKPVRKSPSDEDAHYSREQTFIDEVFHVLRLCRRLKSLYIHNTRCGYVRWDKLSAYMYDLYPFCLRSLSLTQSIDGTVEFVRDQAQVNQLVLFSSARIKNNDPDTEPTLPLPIILPQLRVLWATPWWSRLILPNSSVKSFGLLHDGCRVDERHALRTMINSLIDDGGHPTVKCLTLPYEDFLWDHETIDLHQYGAAFPNTGKLCVTLPGIERPQF